MTGIDDRVYAMVERHGYTRTSGLITSYLLHGQDCVPLVELGTSWPDAQRAVVAALKRLRTRGLVEHRPGRSPGWMR